MVTQRRSATSSPTTLVVVAEEHRNGGGANSSDNSGDDKKLHAGSTDALSLAWRRRRSSPMTSLLYLLFCVIVVVLSLMGVHGIMHYIMTVRTASSPFARNNGYGSGPLRATSTTTTRTKKNNKREHAKTEELEKQPKQQECTIYTAPTSLKGVPSMGIYTTRDIQETESILAAPDGPTVTLLIGTARGKGKTSPDLFPSHVWVYLWGNYAWGRGRGLPEHVSYEASQVMDFQIANGALPNHHCILNAIDFRFPDTPYDDSMTLHRKSPGTGAYSYNRGRDFYVKRNVSAGEELFLNYGYCSKDADRPDWAKDIIMVNEYKRAAEFILKKFKEGFALDAILQRPTLMEDRVAGLLPKMLGDLESVAAVPRHDLDKLTIPDIMKDLARLSGINKRTPEWIRENGMCLEHIIPAPSNIPDAGYGGFAQHFIAKGATVVPAPMLHVMDKKQMILFDDEGHKLGRQLLVNYCLSHPESSLLLCPNTNANSINHCSERFKQKGCENGPNAKYEWSKGWDKTSDAWRLKSLDEIAVEPFRGLSMEVVALRDIHPGEEIFIDYGHDWEEAWRQHVKTWKPPEEILTTAKEANESNDPPDFLITGDMRLKPTRGHLFAGCQYWDTDMDYAKEFSKRDRDWRTRTDQELLSTYADDGSEITDVPYKHHEDLSYWPCVIIRKEEQRDGDAEDSYLVRILQHPYRPKLPWAKHKVPRFLTNYPRSSMHFFVKQTEGDQYLPGVFRHPIGFPEQLFPEHWKNLKNKED